MTEIQLTKTELAEWRDIVRAQMSNGTHIETAARIADAYIVACRERDASRTTEPPSIAEIFFRHFDIGWAVFDNVFDNGFGEGIEDIKLTRAAAEALRDATWEPDERPSVDIYPVAFMRDGSEADRVIRLTEEEFATLDRCRALVAGRVAGGESER